MFVGSYTSARLALTTPPDCCCNCGGHGQLEFVDTPMKQVRFFFVFGTELTLTESFPYCAGCKGSAKRARHGWLAKGIVYCLVTSCAFLGLVMSHALLPGFVAGSLFYSALILSALLTAGYYTTRKPKRAGGTYYQPVELTEAWIGDKHIARFELAFHNARYAAAMRRSNAELIDAGVFKIQ
ncbi:hypothetical protein [Massilia litorea]|jgi:hypothetical protein|uniref:Transmembrane protein n=1 Tax=Massilia litorea TaxID=2769491 RepID=A0A7L9U4Z7_9BURK|nr:hypothetical protein [Massilia litorea]QOL49116.1 hypothetical protein LPB04_19655 [Massilia litorea]